MCDQGSPCPSLLITREESSSPFTDCIHVKFREGQVANRPIIESMNARIRKAVKARGHFPTEQAALTRVYLVVMSLDPTGKARQRWSNRWKLALNAFTVSFLDRILTTTK